MKTLNHEQLALHVSWVTLLWNALLSAAKFFAGAVAHSGAMISDAAHSASDVLSTIVVMTGVHLAAKKPDHEHPYGHDRLECVAALFLAVILLLTGLWIGYDGIYKILRSAAVPLQLPGALALVAAAVSVLVKEIMYRYTRRAAIQIDSGALMADAWHHRSDALSSVGSFIGILGARLGLPFLDPLTSVFICLLILKASMDILKDSINKMIDRACDDDTLDQICTQICLQKGVLGIDRIATRLLGSRIYVEVEIRANGKVPLYLAHQIAHNVHDSVEDRFPKVKHCMVHVNPDGRVQDSFGLPHR